MPRRVTKLFYSGTIWKGWQKASGGPGLEDEAMVKELLNKAFASFDGDHQRMITLFMEGNSIDKVAQEVGFSSRMVQRVVKQFREKLFQLFDQE